MSSPGKGPWWKQHEVHALVVKEVVPVAGVLLAGWDAAVVVFMFWFETAVIWLALLIFVLVRPSLYRGALEEKAWLKGGAFILFYAALSSLVVALLCLVPAGWLGVVEIAEMLEGPNPGGGLVDLSWNPLDVIRHIGRLVTEAPSIGGGMIVLAGSYAAELARILRSSASYEAGGTKVWDLYLARLGQFAALCLLMYIVFGAALSMVVVPEVAAWVLAFVIALKIVFDVIDHVRAQTREEQRATSPASAGSAPG